MKRNETLDYKNKILVITGGTGSFGNAVLDRFLKTDIAEIRIFSRDEKKQEDMRIRTPDDRVKFYIGDVRDRSSLDSVMKGANYVFHAAALKQVPSCEFFPTEAIKTNISGTENAIRSAVESNVERFVLLSTDKAVYPINAMGMTKAVAEKVLIAESRRLSSSDTILSATRYGNVMASRGSVIPLFFKQAFAGEVITVTDPSMTRFLMSLEESVDLVLHSFVHAEQGDIFVQKAPASTVLDIAKAVKKLAQSGVEIKTIGSRHGEKLFETLISREEKVKAVSDGDYFRIPADNRDLNYGKYFTEGEEKANVATDYTSHNTEQLDLEQTIALIDSLGKKAYQS